MGLENLKFWHWMIVGVLVGVGFGYVKSQLRDVSGPTVRSWDRGQFSEALSERRTTLAVRKLVLHPPSDGQEWVSGEIYQRKEGGFAIYDPGIPPPARTGRFARLFSSATTQPTRTAKIELPPGGTWKPLDLLAGDSKNKAKEYQRPGAITRQGATATFTAPNHGYHNGEVVTISGAAQPEYNGTFTISNVTANTFDYPVKGSPESPAKVAANATIAAGITAREYLTWLQKEYPPQEARDLTFRFAWWESPQNMMAIYGGGGFVLIGVIWPAIIALLMGAGLAKRPEKSDYDLSRFKGGQEKKEAKATVNQQDQDQLAELNARLEAGVADMLQGETEPDIDHDAEHAAVVKKLETRTMDATEHVAAAPEEPKEYGGEFYPVVKPHGHKDEHK